MEQIIYWFDGVFDADLHTNGTASIDRKYYDIEKVLRYANEEDDLEKNKAETIIGVLRKQDELNHAF